MLAPSITLNILPKAELAPILMYFVMFPKTLRPFEHAITEHRQALLEQDDVSRFLGDACHLSCLGVPFLESRASAAVIATSLIIAAVGIILPFTRLGGTLGFVPLPSTYWILLCLILVGYAILTHLVKTWFVRKFGLD